jgi:hypothetical protein
VEEDDEAIMNEIAGRMVAGAVVPISGPRVGRADSPR